MQLQNTSSNDLGGAATVLTEVLDSDGQVIFSQTANYPQLAANALKQEQYPLQLSNAKAGNYINQGGQFSNAVGGSFLHCR